MCVCARACSRAFSIFKLNVLLDTGILALGNHGPLCIILRSNTWTYRMKGTVRSAFVIRASPLFITISSTAISWSAVPEQPLDVTSDGFRQGTTKKGIGSHQSRCESVVISGHRFYLLAYMPLSAHVMLSEWEELQRVVKKGEGKEQGKRKSCRVRQRGQLE